MSGMRDDYEPLTPAVVYIDSSGQPRQRRHRGNAAFIVNGRPADLQPLPTIDPLCWDEEPIPERRWIVPGIIPEGNVTMLNGDGGLGKSQLALQLLAACTIGRGGSAIASAGAKRSAFSAKTIATNSTDASPTSCDITAPALPILRI
jgi:hypothetical protein